MYRRIKERVMIMRRKTTLWILVFVLVGIININPVYGYTNMIQRPVNAIFRNIRLIYNGEVIETYNEPFVVDGITYVPIRVVAETLGKYVHWDESSSTITISDQAGSADLQYYQSQIKSMQQQLLTQSYEIADLKSQLANKYDSDDEDDDDDERLYDLEDDLEDDYGDYHSIDFDFTVRGDEDDLEVEIEYDHSEDGSRWRSWSRTGKRNYIRYICNEIWDEFDDDVDIEGYIRDTDSNDKVLEFTADHDETPRVTHYGVPDDGDDLEDDLEDDYEDIENEVDVSSIDVDIDDDDVEFTVELDADKTDDDWRDLRDSEIEDFMKDIARDIEHDYDEDDYTIKGELIDEDGDELATFRWDEDGDHYFHRKED